MHTPEGATRTLRGTHRKRRAGRPASPPFPLPDPLRYGAPMGSLPRHLVGLLTMGLALIFGLSLIRDHPIPGAILLCLAAHRGWVLAQEWRPRAGSLSEQEPAEEREGEGGADEPDHDVR